MAKEKQPDKQPDNELIIEGWQKGMAQHPMLGIGLLRNVDVATYPGIVRLNKSTTKVSSTTITNIVYFIVRDPTTGNLYALDKSSKLYKSTNGGATWSYISGFTESGSGWGLAVWKDYVFVATATGLDVMKISDESKTLLWAPASVGSAVLLDPTLDFHTMLASQDDKLYICAGRYVASIAENAAPFAPATAGSFVYTKRAITLAAGYNAKCLVDLGSNLMIGTWYGTNFGLDFKIADIFPYYKSSLTLGIPLKLGENGIHAMLTVANRVFILAGASGKLFVTDGVTSELVTQIPPYAVNMIDVGVFLMPYPQSIMYHRNKIFYGIGIDSAVGIKNLGIWSYDLIQKVLQMETTVSTGQDGLTNNLLIGAMYSMGIEQFIYSFRDGATYGIDSKNRLTFYSGTAPYPGVIESALYQLGEDLVQRTMAQCEVYFAKPLVTGQGIQILYRKDLTSSFVLLATIDFATYGAIVSKNVSAAVITNAVFLQIKINMTGGGSDSPELKRVMFKMSV